MPPSSWHIRSYAHGNEKRVLLVDDDFAVLAGLAGVLVSEGYHVIHAVDGDEAIEKVRKDSSFDLVLLDLNMPKKSGWDAFEQMHAIDPFLPVIVITARPGQYATAVAAGVGALIEKPLDLPFLLQKIGKVNPGIRAGATGADEWTGSKHFILPGTKRNRWRSIGSGD